MVAGSDYPDWTVPQAHANAIAATGTPLLSLPSALVNGLVTVNAGVQTAVAPVNITMPSYEIRFNTFQSAAGAAGPLQILAQWFDPATAFMIDQQFWDIWPGTTTQTHVIGGKGPSRGLPLQLSFNNTSVAAQYTISYQVYERSHIYTKDDWRSIIYTGTASGGTIAVTDLPSNAIAWRQVSVAAAGTDFTELPLFSGRAFLYARTGSNGADLIVTLDNSANVTAWTAQGTIGKWKTDANGNLNTEVFMPRSQCRARMNNTNAGAQTCIYSLVAADY